MFLVDDDDDAGDDDDDAGDDDDGGFCSVTQASKGLKEEYEWLVGTQPPSING
jgi:hypothetical protein